MNYKNTNGISKGKLIRIVIIVAWLVIACIYFLATKDFEESALIFPIGATWSFCWIGFPIGWRLCRNEYGEATIMTCIAAVMTMAFSLLIAMFQIIATDCE